MRENPTNCFTCDGGEYKEVMEDFRVNHPNGKELVISNLKFLRCDKCKEEIIPPDSSRQVELEIKANNEYEDDVRNGIISRLP